MSHVLRSARKFIAQASALHLGSARYAAGAAILGLALVQCAPTVPAHPNILIITLDTTRVDRLGIYGCDRETTPHLDRLAAESVVYTDAISSSSWTLPAHASLLTGRFTSSHGARSDPNGSIVLSQLIDGNDGLRSFRARGIGEGAQTIATVLRESGFATHAIVAGPWLKREMGLDLGFDEYDDSNINRVNGRPASDVTDAALRWLDDRRQPFFLMVNYYDPHGPYVAPERFLGKRPPLPPDADYKARKRQKSSRRYEAEIRFMDHHIGRLFDGMRERALYDDTWIIVTADHGELLGEHGITGHGTSLHQEVLQIPLVLKYPGNGTVVETRDERAQLVDILPTILADLGLPIPADVQGQPLDRLDHPVVAEIYPSPQKHYDGEVQALFEGSYKLVQKTGGRVELYDLFADPRERENLIEQRPEQGASMQAGLTDYLSRLPAPAPDTLIRRVDPETEAALRGLGYIE